MSNTLSFDHDFLQETMNTRVKIGLPLHVCTRKRIHKQISIKKKTRYFIIFFPTLIFKNKVNNNGISLHRGGRYFETKIRLIRAIRRDTTVCNPVRPKYTNNIWKSYFHNPYEQV